MIDEKRIKEAESNVRQYLEDNLMTKKEENKNLVGFYLKTAKMSLRVAEILFNLSKEDDSKEKLLIEKEFECYLWVTVSSYYSLFYVANGALASLGIKVGDKIAHKITSDCLIFYFIKTGKLAKHYFEEYEVSMKEVLEIMGIDEQEFRKKLQQQALELIQTFDFERKKRGDFQYKTTTSIKENLAKTSLERAKTFLHELEQLIARDKNA